MEILSDQAQKNLAPSTKQYIASLDPSNPLGFLEKVFEFVARECDLFKSDSLVNDVNAVVRRVKDRVEAEDKKRKEVPRVEENGKAEKKMKEAADLNKDKAEEKKELINELQANNGPREMAENNGGVVTWSYEDEKRLRKPWSTVSYEVGKKKKTKGYWENVAAFYNENRPRGAHSRSWTAIKEHYYSVMRDVNQFSEWYWRFYYEKTRDHSLPDPLEAAFAHWDLCHPTKKFNYMHIWRVMKGSHNLFPLKIDNPANKETKKPELQCHASAESIVRSPPMGQPEGTIKKWGEEVQEEGTTPTDSEKLPPPLTDHQAKKKTKTPESGFHASAESKIRSRPMGQPEGTIEKWGEEGQEEGTKRKDSEKLPPLQIDHQANKKTKISKSGEHASTESKVQSRPIGQPGGSIEKWGEEVQEEGMKQKEMRLKEAELMQKDYDIIMRDTRGLMNAQREFHFKIVNQIRARHM